MITVTADNFYELPIAIMLIAFVIYGVYFLLLIILRGCKVIDFNKCTSLIKIGLLFLIILALFFIIVILGWIFTFIFGFIKARFGVQ